MKKLFFLGFLLSSVLISWSQKKPLDHSVYDAWQSVGERVVSSDGRFVAYTVNPQEGDGRLFVESTDGTYKKEISRGYHVTITPDSRFVICMIKPPFKDTREARVRKKKPEDMPKDSLAMVELGKDSIYKVPRVKSYKIPEKAGGWVAYLLEKQLPKPGKQLSDSVAQLTSMVRLADSLGHVADSLRNKAIEARTKGLTVLQGPKKENKKPAEEPQDEGTELRLKNLQTGDMRKFTLVSDYLFGRKGNRMVIATTRKNNDSLVKPLVVWMDLSANKQDTVMKGFNAVRNFAFDDDSRQLAFVAERDSALKSLQKFYRLWYFTAAMDSARMIVDRNLAEAGKGLTVSENFNLFFSRNGARLFLGLAPIRPVRDTTVPDFEKAALDVWNYQDDDLQPVQLKNLDKDLKKSFLAVWDIGKSRLQTLGDEKFPEIQITEEGNGEIFYSASDFGRRVARQWQGYSISDVYAVQSRTGEKKLIVREFKGNLYPSYTGKYLLLYDDRQRSYSIYNSETGALNKIAADVKVPFYDEENDVPDDPAPYGIAGWEKDDRHVYVYDRYAIWKIDPSGKEKSTTVFSPTARMSRIVWRYVKWNRDEQFIDPSRESIFRLYYEKSKNSLFARRKFSQSPGADMITPKGLYACYGLEKADSAEVYLYSRETFSSPPDLYVAGGTASAPYNVGQDSMMSGPAQQLPEKQLTHLNPQQAGYLWGTAELFTWKSYTGRQTEGIVYKPENFDSSKKYPLIVYYYERNNSTLYNYTPPSPTPSRLNIPFFVSRGYVVFVPDIWYNNGHPGKSAYDYVMSGTRSLVKKGYIDSTRMGLQGQSWGGYQTAYLITRTHLFAAAWAGAPVVNMFSAYGGIRWESGLNRQFQYEKTQSRIGASLWERPDLYTENSPLFYLPKVKTPLVIMSNDADGAVPWYQGIEFFTAMRRLNKPVWLLSYNGEAHNLVERRNRKDIQIREQQFFDWLLKGDHPPKWITDGVPAVLKGVDWGLGTE